MPNPIACTPKYLPLERWVAAAAQATKINPANHPQAELLARIVPSFTPTREHIAAMTTKYWHTGSVEIGRAHV